MVAGKKDALINVELMGGIGDTYQEQFKSRAKSSKARRFRTPYPALVHSMECAALLGNACLS